MAIDERARHQLFQRLEEKLGAEEAATLMGLLPPVGWADVATKRDLDALEQRLDARIDALEPRFDARLQEALRQQTRTFMFFTSTLMLTLVGIVLGTR